MRVNNKVHKKFLKLFEKLFFKISLTVWRVVWRSLFQINPLPLQFMSPINSGLQDPPFQSLKITWFPKAVLMVRSMCGTFTFNQPYKQTESKIQVTKKISNNK